MTEELVEQYKKKGRFINFLSRVTMAQAILVIFVAGIIVAISKGGIDQRYNYVIYAGFIVIILVMYFKTSATKKLLPREIIVQRAQEELNLMLRKGQFPFDSKVFVAPACQTKYKDDLITGDSGVPLVYVVGFYEMVHGSQFKRDGIIELNPFSGNISGINWKPLGFSGTEVRDIKIIPVATVQGTFKTSEFGKPQF